MRDSSMRTLLLMTMMIFANTSIAGLYKWVDNEGNIHYSQKRPANSQYKRLKAPPAAPENSTPLYQSLKTKTDPNSILADELAKNEKLQIQNCTAAKKNLINFTTYRRFKDKNGNIKTMDDATRAAQIDRAKEAISTFCD